jgi:hypothetical protein
VEILVKDLKVFASFNEELFKEITQLLTLDNFRYAASFEAFFRIAKCFVHWANVDVIVALNDQQAE